MKLLNYICSRKFRRVYDRICGEGVMIAILGAVCWLIGFSINWLCENSTVILTRVIDWAGEHAIAVALVMALMIAACVVIDCLCGEDA